MSTVFLDLHSETFMMEFRKWCDRNAVQLDYIEDWSPWFKCFEAGALTYAELLEQFND